MPSSAPVGAAPLERRVDAWVIDRLATSAVALFGLFLQGASVALTGSPAGIVAAPLALAGVAVAQTVALAATGQTLGMRLRDVRIAGTSNPARRALRGALAAAPRLGMWIAVFGLPIADGSARHPWLADGFTGLGLLAVGAIVADAFVVRITARALVDHALGTTLMGPPVLRPPWRPLVTVALAIVVLVVSALVCGPMFRSR